MFWSTLGRVIVVPLAFIAAGAVAVFVLVTLGLEQATHAVQGRGDGSLALIFELVSQAHIVISGLTIVPVLALIIIGEVARIRSSLYYILGAGAALGAVPLLVRFGAASGQMDGFTMPAPLVLQVFATAGFAGGFVYWLLAGRKA